jgi:hypothetical protein
MSTASRVSLGTSRSARGLASRSEKRECTDTPEDAFSKRFAAVLFSLYNPHIAPELNPLPSAPSAPKPKGIDKAPAFDSPLCTYRVRTDLQKSAEDQAAVVAAFDQRSRVLLAEIKKDEYDIEVSMVPYDVERTAGDRMSTRSGATTPASGRRSVGGRSSRTGA